VAYYAHTTDLRQGTIPILNEAGKDLTGNQNLIVYTFYAFGQPIGREVLQSAAKAGGFEDKNGNNLPDLPEEWDRINNLSGAAGADGVPDTYFESADADDLRDRLLATINSILQRSSSGTSASVLASSSTGEGSLYQAYFYPSTVEGNSEVKWTGYVQGLFVDAFGNIREDSDGDGRLIHKRDYIIKTLYDGTTASVKVERYKDDNDDGQADLTIDTNSDGKPDKATPFQTVDLKDTKAIWEGGRQLALMDPNARKLSTWVDTNNNGLVDSAEQIDFSIANKNSLKPYLREGTAPFTDDNIINFIRGSQIVDVSGSPILRNRELSVAGVPGKKVWKLGDPIHSTPTVIGAPRERYDVIYGDASYNDFYKTYKDRRQVAYVGANDGMLHAFNAGFYNRGDDPSTPEKEHGWFTTQRASNPVSNTPPFGDELWGFIPMQLLPHLKWLTDPNYTHVYYVDLKPKVTDVRIFCDSAPSSTPPPNPCVNGQAGVSHPGGWGTILIGGFRMGGSCGNCPSGAGRPMTVNADFNGDGDTTDASDTRTFYSAYFILDITDPEVPGGPKLLWTFSDAGLGFSTSYPAVVRAKPACTSSPCNITDSTDAKWFVLFGSGPTSYEIQDDVVGITQSAKLYAVNLMDGPGVSNSLVTTLPVGSWKSFMGDLITVDRDLNYAVDVAYIGRVIHDGSLPWRGKLHRLSIKCPGTPCTTSTWGVNSGGNRVPTEVIDTFTSASGTTEVGPIAAAPTVTQDNDNKVWIFFGTGRFYGQLDKTNSDIQYFFGIKDSVMSGFCTETSATSCYDNDLVNVSSAIVCSVCTGNQISGVPGVTTLEGTTTTSLQGLVASKDGWFTTLPTTRERVLSTPTLLGGIIFFPSFIPVDDPCKSSGIGNLYALFYLTGSAYKESVIGTDIVGGNTNVKRSISLGEGQTAQLGVHIGRQGSDSNGSYSGGGCQGGVSIVGQSSTGAISNSCVKPALSSWSRYLSWNNQRN
jgi:type IV pilus assembly protein PilY1